MPVILTAKEERDTWLKGNDSEAMRLQRPLWDFALTAVHMEIKKTESLKINRGVVSTPWFVLPRLLQSSFVLA